MDLVKIADRLARQGHLAQSLEIYEYVVSGLEQSESFDTIGRSDDITPFYADIGSDAAVRGLVEVARGRVRELVETRFAGSVQSAAGAVQRLCLVVAGLVAIVVVAGGLMYRFGERELSVGATWWVNRDLSGAMGTGTIPSHANFRPPRNYLFQSADGIQPTFTVDLGRPYELSRALVVNRRDCCQDRARDLEILTSLDGKAFVRVAKHTPDAAFSEWNVELAPHSARYVQFRIPDQRSLHLADVRIFGR